MKFGQVFTLAALAVAPAFARRIGGSEQTQTQTTPRRLETTLTRVSQTYFVPLPEDDLMEHAFENCESRAEGDVNSMVSITVTTDGTVVWYDHHEDGFEDDATQPAEASTQIWGDGDPLNGCAPGVEPCNAATDVLAAGQVILLESLILLEKSGSVYTAEAQGFKYDGGDKIQASFPIAVTRGAYPTFPGAVMGGAVEVFDTFSWGTEFVAPIGMDTNPGSGISNAFTKTQYFVMAGADETVVTTGDGDVYNLNQGQSVQFFINEGDTLTSTRPVQIDIVAISPKQIRWFSLYPLADWFNSYIAPMGDTRGKTRVRLFNPHTSTLPVTFEEYGKTTSTVNVPAGESIYSGVIDSNRAARFTADENFMALSVTDTSGCGCIYDWGYPLIPTNKLTPEVIIGWGYGCEGDNCRTKTWGNNGNSEERSVVYLTPTARAKVWIDYDNDGVVDDTFDDVAPLQCLEIFQSSDMDMSGARIWATDFNDSTKYVEVAAAWGQDPDRSGGGDASALDLGTVVVPFVSIAALKTSEIVDTNGDGLFGPGDTISYTIQLSNVGTGTISPDRVSITDELDPEVTYVAGSLTYISPSGSQDVSGSTFPLAGLGMLNPYDIVGRGGQHQITFDVIINDDTNALEIINNGAATFGNQVALFGSSQQLESGGSSPRIFIDGGTQPRLVPDGDDEEVICEE